MNMYSAIGSQKEPKASVTNAPEQRSYWAVQLHYESNAIPLRMQIDIHAKFSKILGEQMPRLVMNSHCA